MESSGHKIALHVQDLDTVGHVKALAENAWGIDIGNQRLASSASFNGKDLEDGRTLADCRIRMGGCLHLIDTTFEEEAWVDSFLARRRARRVSSISIVSSTSCSSSSSSACDGEDLLEIAAK